MNPGRMVAVVPPSPDHEACARLVRANSPPSAIVYIPCAPAHPVFELERDEKHASVPTLSDKLRNVAGRRHDHARLMPDGIGNCHAHLKEPKTKRFVGLPAGNGASRSLQTGSLRGP
jgi:hypothetical protein